MRLEASSLRSKVARRIFFIFLLCGLLPFAALVAISYYQVGSFFDEKNHRQLRDLAKLYGMDVHERLQLLHSSLAIIAASIQLSGELPDEESLRKLPGLHQDRWDALLFFKSDGSRQNILGRSNLILPAPTPEHREHRAAGKAVILIIPSGTNSQSRLLMTVRIDPDDFKAGILAGEIKDTYLWGIRETRLMPSHVDACVKSPADIVLSCSSSMLNMLPRSVDEQIRRNAIGDIAWRQDGRNYIASYWTAPMEYEFGTPGWKIVLRTTRDGAFASIADLRNTFLLGIVASAGLSMLLAMAQIRRQLTPVEQLKEGTQRIARQEFDYRVAVESDDEFGELGASVNSMADQLGRQFGMLSTKSEIDRAILSLLNTEKIVETILTRFSALFHCDITSLTLINDEESHQAFILDHGVLRTRHDKEIDSIIRRAVETGTQLHFEENEIRALAPNTIEFGGVRSIMASPLTVQNKVLAVLAFYATKRGQFDPQELRLLGELTSQAAIAIFNSQLFERTKHHVVELEKANKAKDDFLAVVSHELRTPLNIILGYMGVLRDKLLGQLNAEQSGAVETVDKHAKDLLELINTILQTTQLEAGAVAIEYNQIELAYVLDNLKTKYALPLDKNLSLSWQYPRNLPGALTDQRQLERILQNIIDNAIKFTPEGEVAVSAAFEPDASVVRFTISDTGIGIAKESLGAIFERFRQLDNTGTREFGGLGLGLFIAKSLARLMGVAIHVESEPGRGSTFTVSLPIANHGKYSAPSSSAVNRAMEL